VSQKEAKADHFRGKEAMQHIVEVQAEGKWMDTELHGAETPGSIFAACDAARQTAILLLLLFCTMSFFEFSTDQRLFVLLAASGGFIVWNAGRASWLAWSRLERLHRVMDEERHEIETNREQERIELRALYKAKGFDGKLLEEVIDVLMADGDRLLRVMLEEEMGFRLEQNEHPLMQAVGAAAGSLVAGGIITASALFSSSLAMPFAACAVLAITSYVTARTQKNKSIAAMSWNVGIGVVAYLTTLFLMKGIVG
jgi:hypothetical protein